MQIDSDFLSDLQKLISFKSVLTDKKDDRPFGDDIYFCLEYFLSLAKSFGFETKNYDNYGGEVIFGEGEELGIMGHLDVVPSGTGWNTPPFSLTKKDGYYYGRGIADDKTPLLVCLYALKELKESGKKINKKFRLIIGCDEESGWRDLDYIKSKTTLPEYGFSPDGNFPVSYAEKGMAVVTFTLPKLKNFYSLSGGTVINAVCSKCTFNSKLDKNSIKFTNNIEFCDNNFVANGKSAHGSRPDLGVNAIKKAFEFFKENGENVDDVLDYLFYDKLKISSLISEQGATTFSPDLISEDKNNIYISCDCRFPYPIKEEDLIKKFNQFPFHYDFKLKHNTQYVEKDSFLIKTLLTAYEEVFKSKGEAISQGGSTFARAFKKGCAFGPEFTDESACIHEPNERISEKNLIKLIDVYKKAIFLLSK